MTKERKWKPDVVQEPGPNPTQQQFKEDADINNIMGRFKTTGVLAGPRGVPNLNGRKAMFGDFTRLEFQDMLNRVTDVQQQFQMIPARTRRRFNNDPANLLAFLEDPANHEKARQMGLLPKEPEIDLNQVDLLDLVEAEEARKKEEAAVAAAPPPPKEEPPKKA